MSIFTLSQGFGIKKVFLDCELDEDCFLKKGIYPTLSFLSDEPEFTFDWVPLKMGETVIWIHFKKIALVDGSYLYETDQFSLTEPDSKQLLSFY